MPMCSHHTCSAVQYILHVSAQTLSVQSTKQAPRLSLLFSVTCPSPPSLPPRLQRDQLRTANAATRDHLVLPTPRLLLPKVLLAGPGFQQHCYCCCTCSARRAEAAANLLQLLQQNISPTHCCCCFCCCSHHSMQCSAAPAAAASAVPTRIQT
jgi:hypothetical protein